MKKGSYGRSKLIGHSPVQRKWTIIAYTNSFVDISYFTIFYLNTTDTNVATINDLGSPVLSLQLNQLKVNDANSYSYDITKLLQTYGIGCYFFAWVDTSGQIQENQLLTSSNGGYENEECLVYTAYIDTYWRLGSNLNTITQLRGAYIKNPTSTISSTDVNNPNNLILQYGLPGSK